MLVFIKDSLSVLAFGFPALSIAALLLRRRVVRGARLKYILKTCDIAFIIATIITNICFSAIEILLSTSPSERAFSCVGGLLLSAIWLWALLRMLKEDDGDDWFNDQWKKAKRWLKSLRAAPRHSLAPTPAH
jgi:hypothetical protein